MTPPRGPHDPSQPDIATAARRARERLHSEIERFRDGLDEIIAEHPAAESGAPRRGAAWGGASLPLLALLGLIAATALAIVATQTVRNSSSPISGSLEPLAGSLDQSSRHAVAERGSAGGDLTAGGSPGTDGVDGSGAGDEPSSRLVADQTGPPAQDASPPPAGGDVGEGSPGTSPVGRAPAPPQAPSPSPSPSPSPAPAAEPRNPAPATNSPSPGPTASPPSKGSGGNQGQPPVSAGTGGGGSTGQDGDSSGNGHGKALGHTNAPPGHGGTPPGHGGTPPGQTMAPPGQSKKSKTKAPAPAAAPPSTPAPVPTRGKGRGKKAR